MKLIQVLKLIGNEPVTIYQLNKRGNQEVIYKGILNTFDGSDKIDRVTIDNDGVYVYLDDPESMC